jgi:type I restriction enzyme M protein
VPVTEIESLQHFWKNYSGLRKRVFAPRPNDKIYADFASEVSDRQALAELVKSDPSVTTAHAAFLETLELWWQKNLRLVEALAPRNGRRGNVYDLRTKLLADIARVFAGQDILTDHQIRGAFARYVDDLKADLKSIAASGWGPELIPDDEILQSQFPELLAEMEEKRLRLAELTGVFAAANEEDYEDSDDTGVLASEQVKILKAEIKEANAEALLAKREKRDPSEFKARAGATEKLLERHKKLEDEAKELKSDLRVNEKKQEELVAAARARIDREEARRVILDRLHRLLVQRYESYLRADQRACLAAMESLHAKYAVTANMIESQRDATARKLRIFLSELGYE